MPVRHRRRKSSRLGREFKKPTDIRRGEVNAETDPPVITITEMNRIELEHPITVHEVVSQRGRMIYNITEAGDVHPRSLIVVPDREDDA